MKRVRSSTTKHMKPVIIKPASHEDWLKARSEGIGASEIGAVVGLSPWETPFSLWLKKTGQVPPVEENEAMRLGHLLEGVVVQLWEQNTEGRAIKASAADIIYQDREHPWRKCTPDRIVYEIGLDGKRSKALLEAKTTIMTVDPENIPTHWLAQVQYQMHITGIHICFLCWLVSGRYFGYSRIEYDREFAEWLVSEADKFYTECVVGGKEPDLISVSDFTIKGSTPGASVEADSEAVEQIKELRTVNTSIAELEAKQEALKDRIKLFMQEAESLTSDGDILATWKTGKKGRTFLLKKARAS